MDPIAASARLSRPPTSAIVNPSEATRRPGTAREASAHPGTGHQATADQWHEQIAQKSCSPPPSIVTMNMGAEEM